MKNRSTRKNKTRNFRKKNRGGMRGKSASNARTFRTFKASRAYKSRASTSRATNMRGDRENVVDGRLWNDSWNEELKKIINPDLLVLMDLDNSNKIGKKYGLIYDIYYQAKNIIYKSQQSEKEKAITKINELIDDFIDEYANDYTGPKLNV
jgi:hypothetical protein